MIDAFIMCMFVFLAGVIFLDSFKKWKNTRKALYFLVFGLCILAAMSAFVDWTSYFYCILGAMIVRVIAQNTGNKKTNETKSNEIDEANK
jgi:asparagine N-glycosylation enzyme membrane subunit Stt3